MSTFISAFISSIIQFLCDANFIDYSFKKSNQKLSYEQLWKIQKNDQFDPNLFWTWLLIVSFRKTNKKCTEVKPTKFGHLLDVLSKCVKKRLQHVLELSWIHLQNVFTKLRIRRLTGGHLRRNQDVLKT